MNKNKSKIIALIILVIIGIIYFATKKDMVPVAVVPDTNTEVKTIQKKEVCYFKETVGTQSTDYAFTSINYDVNNKVHGLINWIPGEKDSLVGAYAGTVEKSPRTGGYDEKLNIIYTGAGEGIISKQQELILVGDNEIKTAIGEKEQDKDGIWRFKDLSKVTYENALPLVDCSVVPDKIKKDYSKTN